MFSNDAALYMLEALEYYLDVGDTHKTITLAERAVAKAREELTMTLNAAKTSCANFGKIPEGSKSHCLWRDGPCLFDNDKDAHCEYFEDYVRDQRGKI